MINNKRSQPDSTTGIKQEGRRNSSGQLWSAHARDSKQGSARKRTDRECGKGRAKFQRTARWGHAAQQQQSSGWLVGGVVAYQVQAGVGGERPFMDGWGHTFCQCTSEVTGWSHGFSLSGGTYPTLSSGGFSNIRGWVPRWGFGSPGLGWSWHLAQWRLRPSIIRLGVGPHCTKVARMERGWSIGTTYRTKQDEKSRNLAFTCRGTWGSPARTIIAWQVTEVGGNSRTAGRLTEEEWRQGWGLSHGRAY
eukprot:768455-Hanusia_phi.AAC.3